MRLRPVRRALLSVADKSGIVELARGLAAAGVELLSTGGTARHLREAGLPIVDVSAVTGFPEILDGRVKTLHPAIHGGLLARRDDPGHEAALVTHGLRPIDLLASDLYPFEQARGAGREGEDLIEEIDVGGPAMIRAAAKNHDGVAVLIDTADYAPVLRELVQEGGTSLETRRRLAAKAFARTAAYDAAVAAWFNEVEGELLPDRLTVGGRLQQRLRYGENPHQKAGFYRTEPAAGLAAARQFQGKELSYNNILDADAALAVAGSFEDPAVAIVKHANPCGVAIGQDAAAAWTRALAADPVSAFGGIVAINRPVDAALAGELTGLFLEVVLAPAIAEDAAAILARKENLRVLALPMRGDALLPRIAVRTVAGGFLAQEVDRGRIDAGELRCVTQREPTAAELADLLFAWTVVRHVKSNAIVLAQGGATVGIGMGQTNRVDAVEIAARRKAQAAGVGSCVVASDAFFPFPDGLIAAAEAGATAVIQPGGSVRDAAVIEAADARGVAMVVTGMRHFRH